jgi:hypothetical protein
MCVCNRESSITGVTYIAIVSRHERSKIVKMVGSRTKMCLIFVGSTSYSTHFLQLIESKILETRKIWRPTPNLESVSKKVLSPNPKQIYWVKVTRQQNTPDIERFGVGDKEKFPVRNGSHGAWTDTYSCILIGIDMNNTKRQLFTILPITMISINI